MLSSRQRARLLLVSSVVLCFCVFFWAGRLFRIPIHPGFEGSLLQQPAPEVSVGLVAAGLVGCCVLGTAVAGMIRFNAGLVTAGFGLAALSARAGTVRDTMFHALATRQEPREVFLQLAAEAAILGGILGVLWLALLKLHRDAIVTDREGPGVFQEAGDSLLSLAIQTVATALFVLVLAASEAKVQVLVTLGVASFCGCSLAQSLYPTSPRTPTWLPPLLVGISGYVMAYFAAEGLATGSLQHWAARLAFPLPVDYAGVGVASATLGHWVTRQWARQGEDFFSKSAAVAREISRRT